MPRTWNGASLARRAVIEGLRLVANWGGAKGSSMLGSEKGKQLDRAPIMAMSGFKTHAGLARLLIASLQGFLPKPFGPDKLMEAI